MCGDKEKRALPRPEARQVQLTGTLPCPPLVAAGDAVAYVMFWPMLAYALFHRKHTSAQFIHPSQSPAKAIASAKGPTYLSCDVGADATEASVESAGCAVFALSSWC